MNQLDFQRKAIMEDMDKEEREKRIDLCLQNARRPQPPIGKWKDRKAVNAHASN